MAAVKGKVVEGGRIIVPAAFSKSMGLSKGDIVFMELHGDELRVRPARSALRRIQAKLRALVPSEGLVSDELIAERRAEAEREQGRARSRRLGPALPVVRRARRGSGRARTARRP